MAYDDRQRALRDASAGEGSPEQTLPARSAIRVVSLFSGCGGMDLGFAGGFSYRGELYPALPFEVVAAYDNDPKCKRTYDKNLPNELTLIDLARVNVTKLPNAEVLIGGFPCQEFSSCGPQGGVASHRGGLFRAMSRYARHHQPKVVVAENVMNLARINGGADLATIRRSLAQSGYRTLIWQVYAPDYGVPQTRQRLIIIAVRKDLVGEPTLPAPRYSETPRSIDWAIEDLKAISDESIPNQSQYFKAGLAITGHGQGDEKNRKGEPAYTIRANSRSRVQFHYELSRRLTVRECARIQTFPDTFVFPDEATPSIRQIGNAVPPVLGHVIAASIFDYLQIPSKEMGVHNGEA